MKLKIVTNITNKNIFIKPTKLVKWLSLERLTQVILDTWRNKLIFRKINSVTLSIVILTIYMKNIWSVDITVMCTVEDTSVLWKVCHWVFRKRFWIRKCLNGNKSWKGDDLLNLESPKLHFMGFQSFLKLLLDSNS